MADAEGQNGRRPLHAVLVCCDLVLACRVLTSTVTALSSSLCFRAGARLTSCWVHPHSSIATYTTRPIHSNVFKQCGDKKALSLQVRTRQRGFGRWGHLFFHG
jgi:hypothetical protein